MSYRGVITPAKLRLTTHPFSFSYNFSHCLHAQSIASVPRFPKLAPVMPPAINTNIIAETSSNIISTHEKLEFEYKVMGIVFRGGYIILNILLHCNSVFARLNKHLSRTRSGYLPPEKAATKGRRAASRMSRTGLLLLPELRRGWTRRMFTRHCKATPGNMQSLQVRPHVCPQRLISP